jgi:transmembrane sensor
MAHAHLAPKSLSKRLFKPGWSIAIASGAVIATALLWIGQSRGVVSTAVGEQRTLTLQDGTRVALNTDTRLSVHFEKTLRLVEIQSGEALFEVAKNPERPFIVLAGNVEVRAVGTEFVVRRDEHRLAVTLMEGKVQITEAPVSGSPSFDRLPEPTVLVPGQRLVLADRERPTVDKPAIDVVTAWRRGDIVLDKTPLSAAAAEMNRYCEVQIVVEGNAAGRIPLSGVFRAGDSAQFARAVAATYGLKLSSEPSRLVLAGVPTN